VLGGDVGRLPECPEPLGSRRASRCRGLIRALVAGGLMNLRQVPQPDFRNPAPRATFIVLSARSAASDESRRGTRATVVGDVRIDQFTSRILNPLCDRARPTWRAARLRTKKPTSSRGTGRRQHPQPPR
jgi:hypothetical protein